jgi:hypothetical protein
VFVDEVRVEDAGACVQTGRSGDYYVLAFFVLEQ